MFSKNCFIAVLMAGTATVLIGGVSAASAQQTPRSPAAKTASPTPTPPIDDNEVIKVESNVVNVLFTAQDRNRRLLTDLKQGDIRLLEDGRPQEISTFSRQVDLPLSLAILIDTSVSQQRT